MSARRDDGLHKPLPLPRAGLARRTLRARLLRSLRLLLLLGVGLAFAVVDNDRMQAFMRSEYGARGEQALDAWRRMLNQASAQTRDEKLRIVNDFFNRRIRFVDDIEVWGKPDYWATPLEFLGKGAGDCEDYAIAKYHSLIELGVPADKLRLIYVRATLGSFGNRVQVAHMVLGYYAGPEAVPLILDNLIPEIEPASQRPDLAPVYSFGSEGLFMNGARGPSASVDRLSLWSDLKTRMRAQGYEP